MSAYRVSKGQVMELKEIERELYHSNKSVETADNKLKELRAELEESEHTAQVVDLSVQILENYLESVSSAVSGTLETMMDSALSVLNMDIKVSLVYREGVRGGYHLEASSSGVTGGIESMGGGVFSIISFVMLVSTIVLKKKRRYIMLDESLNAVSSIYQEPLSMFIRKLCEDFDFSITIISHQPILNTHANECYIVSKSKKGSVIKLDEVS